MDLHGDVLYRFALLRVKDPHVAEDLVQDTLVAGLEGWDRFKAGSSVRTWLVGILKHKIVDHFRKSAREVSAADLAHLDERDSESALERKGQPQAKPSSWADNPYNLLENKEFLEVFTHCLDALPEAFRRAFTLREIEGLRSDEICKILQVTSTNLWVILHRTRARLRECLDARWFQRG